MGQAAGAGPKTPPGDFSTITKLDVKREGRQAIQSEDKTLDNRDDVAFETLPEGFARITAELTKKRDRIMRSLLADDQHPDAREVADRIDDYVHLLNAATD